MRTRPEPDRLRAALLLGVAALVAGLAAVLPATPAWAVVLPAVPAATAPAASAAAQAGHVAVAMVVDFGPAGADRVVVKCLDVTAGSTGLDVLDTLAGAQGWQQPGTQPGGYVCSIDGLPTDGADTCEESGQPYWSYWHGGSGGWTYSHVGAGGFTVTQGDVEGWRFEPESTTVAPPAQYADYAADCPTTTTTTGSPATTAPPAGAPTTAAAGTTPAVGSKESKGSTAAPPTTVAPGSTTSTTTRSKVASTRSKVASTTSTTGTRTGSHLSALPVTKPTSGSGGGGSGGTIALIVAGVVVIGLGVGAVLRWRRRPEPT